MKNRPWLIKCIIVCLASVCLYMADDSVREEAWDGDDFSVAASYVECSGISFSAASMQCRISRNQSSFNSLRASFQTQRENSAGFVKKGFTIVKAGKPMSESTRRLIVLGKLII